MSKPASLTSGLVAKKGHAVPTVKPSIVVESKAQSTDYYKALTVKLDRERYEKLKNVGVKLDKRSQEIFVEALDLWLKQESSQHA
jgi:hypothetical protein